MTIYWLCIPLIKVNRTAAAMIQHSFQALSPESKMAWPLNGITIGMDAAGIFHHSAIHQRCSYTVLPVHGAFSGKYICSISSPF
jgi:hypothetical protein